MLWRERLTARLVLLWRPLFACAGSVRFSGAVRCIGIHPRSMASNAIERAKEAFPADVIEALESSGILEYNMEDLTRDDIDQEFKAFKFGVRKSIFSFLKGLLDTTEDTVASTVDEESEEGCPLVPALLALTQNHAMNLSIIWTLLLRTHLGQSFLQCPPTIPIPPLRQLESYPGNIPQPFPLSDVLRSFLLSPRAVFLRNRAVFLQVVRDVCLTLESSLGRRPRKDELICTAKRMVQEFPVLQCGKKECYGAFYEALNKRINNSTANRTNRKKTIERFLMSTPRPARKAEVLDPEKARRTVRAIHKLEGDGIAEKVLSRYPELSDCDKFLETLGAVQDKTLYDLLQDATTVWVSLRNRLLPDEHQVESVFECLGTVICNLAPHNKQYLLRRDLELPEKRRGLPDFKQPYLLIPENTAGNFEVAVIVDNIPFIKFEAFDSDQECGRAILTLLGVYFILNLEYPWRAKGVYAELEREMDLKNIVL